MFLRLLFFRDSFTLDDVKVYAAVVEKPSDHFPNASRWYDCISSKLAARFVLYDQYSFVFADILHLLLVD